MDDEPTISFVDDFEGGARCGHGHVERVLDVGFRKMTRGDSTDYGGDWTEHGIAWDNVAGKDGTMDDDPTISFVDDPEGGASYDVNVSWAWPQRSCTRRRTPIQRGRG